LPIWGFLLGKMFADRSTGRLGGLNNSESGGVADAKNLRVKVSIWTLHYRLSFFFFFLCVRFDWTLRKLMWVREQVLKRDQVSS
jgi:hypothetical protein